MWRQLQRRIPICQECGAFGGSGLGFLCRHVQLLVRFVQADHSAHLSRRRGQLQGLSDVSRQLTFALKHNTLK